MPARSPHRVAAITLILGWTALTTGCAPTSPDPAASRTSTAPRECRATWTALEKDLAGRDTGTAPSHLTDRWSSILAGVHYHAVAGTASDCGEPLTALRAAISRLNEFEARIQDFDMELARDELHHPGEMYLDSPVPSRSALGGSAKPVSHAAARTALQTLESLAAEADADLAAGWAEANTVDLDDTGATDKVVADLKLLSSRSDAYQRCASAVSVLRTVLKQQFEALSRAPSRR